MVSTVISFYLIFVLRTFTPRSIRELGFESCIRILRISHALGHEPYYIQTKEYLIEQVKSPESAWHSGLYPSVLYHLATTYDIGDLLLPSITLQLAYSSQPLDPPPAITEFTDDDPLSTQFPALLSQHLSAVSALAVQHVLKGVPRHQSITSIDCKQQNTGCSLMARESIWRVGRLSVEVMDNFKGDIHDFLTKLLTVVWRKFDVCEPCAAMWKAEIQRSLRKLEEKMRKWTRTLPQNDLSNEELTRKAEKHARLVVKNIILLP
jgi:hypothetical protein